MLLFLPLALPFATVVLTLLAWRRPALRRGLSLAGALTLLGAGGAILARVLATGPFAQQAGGWPAPYGITLVADGLSASLVALTGVTATLALVFARADVTAGEEHAGFHPLVHAMLAGVAGAFLTGDLFNMYVWFEVMLISTFGLLVIGSGSLDGAMKYVGLNLIGTVAFITGVGLLYGTTGALNMADLHARLLGRGDAPVLAAAALLVFAFAAKAALAPLHFWLPASYHTPAFTTSALFAALLTKVGVYALVRVFSLVFDTTGTPIHGLLLALALVSMALGCLGALVMPSVRRVLGFSITASIGAMVLGLAVGTPAALAATILYLGQDVLVKAALFLGAGAIAHATGSETLARSGGLWRSQPATALLFLVPALALAGMPPFSGFWPKLMLVRATLEAGSGWLAAAVLAMGLLTLVAMARVWAEAVWAPAASGAPAAPLPPAMLWPLAILAALIIVAGVWAGPLVGLADQIAGQILDPAAYIAALSGHGR
ncbi:MAG: proton-conducting transporter membrane subunit [Amaricoccus sp.]|uniref:proton-conducting transporter transmembrane domain-containing protein n=1 Tax=Amaricoccus sp. TaxID=1872485 RepID=UPI0039E23B5D